MIDTDRPSPTREADRLTVRELRQSDLPEADRVMRAAFNTFVGVPDLFGDKDYVRTRWTADPSAALAAELDGRLVGSNFVTSWGSVGFFGPLSVRPELWDKGVARQLMAATLDVFTRWDTRHAGLFTFGHSPKHLWLYQKFGFWPRALTPVMVLPVSAGQPTANSEGFTQMGASDRARVLDASRELTGVVYDGLDLTREIEAVSDQRLGEVVLIDDAKGLCGIAICHVGEGTEAGGGGCYVKFGAVLPGPGADDRFTRLLDSCESLAADRGASHVELGVNAARHEAYAAVVNRGYRAVMVGVAMNRDNDPGYSKPGVYVIDDWR